MSWSLVALASSVRIFAACSKPEATPWYVSTTFPLAASSDQPSQKLARLGTRNQHRGRHSANCGVVRAPTGKCLGYKTMRVLMILQRYPQLSETYVSNELRVLWPNYEISVLSLGVGNVPQQRHFPYELAGSTDDAYLTQFGRTVRPQMIHAHYLHLVPLVHRVAESLKTPYTIRTHSYDILGVSADRLRCWSEYVNHDRCIGILAFPFLRQTLTDAGMSSAKIHDCYPVVDYDRFYNRSLNMPGVMNVGAALPKKNMMQYLQLATHIDAQPVRLYALGYEVTKLRALNDSLGQPVIICDPVPARRYASRVQAPYLVDLHGLALRSNGRVAGRHRRGAGLRRWRMCRGNQARSSRLCRRGRFRSRSAL